MYIKQNAIFFIDCSMILLYFNLSLYLLGLCKLLWYVGVFMLRVLRLSPPTNKNALASRPVEFYSSVESTEQPWCRVSSQTRESIKIVHAAMQDVLSSCFSQTPYNVVLSIGL